MPTASIDIADIHEVAGVPDGAEIISYDWNQHGLTIKYDVSHEPLGGDGDGTTDVASDSAERVQSMDSSDVA